MKNKQGVVSVSFLLYVVLVSQHRTLLSTFKFIVDCQGLVQLEVVI